MGGAPNVSKYSGVLSCVLFAALWPLAGRTQVAEGQRGAAPESVRVLEEVIERLTDAPLYRDNDVELLLDGPETHSAMLEAIASAEHHVHLETYILVDDEVGTKFADALAAKARMGVAVRVIYDSIGSREASEGLWARLEAAGVAVRAFNPPDPSEDRNPFDIDTRDHRKLLVVDGRVAFTGGINIDRNYARPSEVVGGKSGASGWRDTHIRIRGPAVAAFQELFVDLWGKIDAPLAEAPYAPPSASLERGDTLVRVLAAVGGNDEASQIWVAYQAAAKVARQRIWITQSYFAPDDEFMAAILEAAARGVDVRILVTGFSDSDLLLNASRAYYADMLEAGIKVFESQEQIMHAKTMVVDGYWSTVGSSNLDYLSFLHNHEANAVILGAAAQLEEVFLADLGNAVAIDAERWNDRSLWQRTKELGSYFIRYRL
jgi:cardiolipin synthase